MVHPTVENSLRQSVGSSDKYRDRFHANKRQYLPEPFGGGGSGVGYLSVNPPLQSAPPIMTFKEDEDEQEYSSWDDIYSNSQSDFGDERSRHSSSSVHSAPETPSRISKDEKLAREAGITFPIQQIVGLPMDEFNDLLSRQDLTEEQTNICRDIRRRGKNKVAAQNCRKRKLDQVAQLQNDLMKARAKGRELEERKQKMLEERNREAEEMNQQINSILTSRNKDPRTHTIVQIQGMAQIVPITNGVEPPGSLRPKPFSLPNIQQQQRDDRLAWSNYNQYMPYCTY